MPSYMIDDPKSISLQIRDRFSNIVATLINPSHLIIIIIIAVGLETLAS